MKAPQLVHNEEADVWGIYYPDRHVIEASIGDDTHEIHGDYLGVNWALTDRKTLADSIEADIEQMRNEIADLYDEALSPEQISKLKRIESQLDDYEKKNQNAREALGLEDEE